MLRKAAELARHPLAAYDAQVRPLRDRLERGILESVPESERNGHATRRLANTSNITFRGIASDALRIADPLGFADNGDSGPW